MRRVARGVYVSADVPDTVPLRCQAISLMAGPNVVVCDRTAAWLHGVDSYGARELRAGALIETCSLRGNPRTKLGPADGRTRDLARDDIMQLHGIEVTTPIRTALDLGCALPRHRALGVLDQFARLHGTDSSALAAELPRFRGRRGVVQLRSLVPIVDARSESVRESWTRLDILDAGLPLPELQWWIYIDGVPTFRLDHAYPEHRVAIEYDGIDFHLRSTEQIEHDRRRRAWLRAEGWYVIVVTKDQLGETNPEWLCLLREQLTLRTRRFRWEWHQSSPTDRQNSPLDFQRALLGEKKGLLGGRG